MVMNEVEKALYKTRKNLLEVLAELGYNNDSEVEIGLERCTDCGIWDTKLFPDLDKNPICAICLQTYGL